MQTIDEIFHYIKEERDAVSIYENILDHYEGWSYLTESTNIDNYFIKDEIYTKVSLILSIKSNQEKFKRYVGEYIDRNSTKLHTAGPQYLIPFLESDKAKYYELFNITPSEINKIVNKSLQIVNDKANFKLLRNNPVFVLFFCIIRYFTINKNDALLNNALILLALSMYPSMFTKYYTHEPNSAVMQYTIDNLSMKFIIKKEKHIFGTLYTSISSSWNYHKNNITNGSDKNCIDFIMRIRNDQNSLMKKISNEYFFNHKHNLASIIEADSFEENNVVDVENNSNKVEAATTKIYMSIIVNGIDLKLAQASAKSCHVGTVDTRNYLTSILTEDKVDELKSFIESIIFLYLYDKNKTISDINSKDFLIHSLSIYKKTNSNNKNIGNIKNILDKWGNNIGLTSQFSRKATINDYKRAIYMYLIFSIQKYN